MNPKIINWHNRRVWLVGASSGIGAALAQELSRCGAQIALSARSAEKMQALHLNGALLLPCDVSNLSGLINARDTLIKSWGGIDIVIYLAGDYIPMRAHNFDLIRAEQIVDTNFNGAMRVFSCVHNDLLAGGGIAFVASVAGYRGLPNALSYGASKAALIHFAQSLYIDLRASQVGVWIINPGFVATQLTAQNTFPMPALLSPEKAALAILKGFTAGSFEIHFPKRFTCLLKLLSLLPDRWYFLLIRRFTGA